MLPHFDILHCHASFGTLAPSWQPRVSGIPEIPRRIRGAIDPWLAANSIPGTIVSLVGTDVSEGIHLLEPAITRANSNVEYQIEVDVKWGIVSCCILPRVFEESPVLHLRREVASFPHVLTRLEIHKKHLNKPTVHIGIDVVFGPFHAKSMELFGEVSATESFAIRRSPVSVRER